MIERELRHKLKQARRALRRAQQDLENIPAEAVDRQTEVDRCRERVQELEQALRGSGP